MTQLNLLTIPAITLVHVTATAAVALLLRVRVCVVSLGVGPALFRRSFGGTSLILRVLPLAGAVHVEPPEGEDPLASGDRGRAFGTLSRIEKAAVYASGCIATGLVAALCLGAGTAWGSWYRTYGQWLGGALHPLGRGQENLRVLYGLMRDAPWITCAGVLAAKMAALNALPIPPLSGFQVLHAVIWNGRENAWLTWLLNLSMLVLLCVLLSYAVAGLTLAF